MRPPLSFTYLFKNIYYGIPSTETTQIESASLELELLNVEGPAAEKARAALATRLAALGANVPVTMDREKSMVRLRAMLAGPRAVDVVYHVENMVRIWVANSKV